MRYREFKHIVEKAIMELAPEQMKADIQQSIAKLNLKDQASVDIIKQLYTVLNKTGLQGRITSVFSKDEDVAKYQNILDKVSEIFLQVAETDPVDAKQFLTNFEKNPNVVDVEGFLQSAGRIVPIESLFTTPIAKEFGKRLSRVQGSGYKQGNVGPGEIALAVLSNKISLTAGEETGGDIEINKKGYEVKGGGSGTGKGGRLFDKGQIPFTNTKKYLESTGMPSAGNLSVEVASRIDPDLQDFDRDDDPEDKDQTPGVGRGKSGVTSDPNIWAQKDSAWWVKFMQNNLTDWAQLYGVSEFLGQPIKTMASILVERMGQNQFKSVWARLHFLAYQQKAKHSGIILVGNNSLALLTDGKHLVDLNVITSYGAIYNESVNQTRDVTIQLGLN
tara:strand:- start:100 stop:1266 length:1167 start_codon:yes stop_codon:yes gene_type:complete